jgi:endonuclease-3
MKTIRAYSAAEKKRALRVLRGLRVMYPDAECELTHVSPFELAVAAILSAQCTDKRVNLVTPALFQKYRRVEDWAATPQAVLEKEIHSTGFFRNKATNIRALANEVLTRFNGVLPQDLETLITLPGIGRKTANVLLISAFGKPGITVDTHCKRVCNRLGFTESDNPDHIEAELKTLLPEKDWAFWSHGIVFHGRYCCMARNPPVDAAKSPRIVLPGSVKPSISHQVNVRA